MSVRKFFFWFHLVCGVIAGSIILIMSVTGVLLAYERQMLAWADRSSYHVEPPARDAQPLPVEEAISLRRSTISTRAI
jgi:uncharacterized iron-regulated membrane protein